MTFTVKDIKYSVERKGKVMVTDITAIDTVVAMLRYCNTYGKHCTRNGHIHGYELNHSSRVVTFFLQRFLSR